MKKYLLIATALVALASCSDDTFVGENSPNTNDTYGGEIVFSSNLQKQTRAGEFVGATAAEKLGRMFVVEGTKGSEQTNSPSTTVVFDNYLVGYEYNSAGRTESNTNNWEYVGLQTGIDGKLSGDTWTALHTVTSPEVAAQAQSVKYWDYSVAQYDFIAWSTGTCEAIPIPDPEAKPASGKVQVSRINTGNTLASNGFTMVAANANDLLQCYYTDINTVEKGTNGVNYGKPVVLTFRNMAAKVRVALYETVPGYSVKDVQFYTSDANPTAPVDLAYDKGIDATLFTMGDDKLPQSGKVLVYYPHIGTNNNTKADYKKASVTVSSITGGDVSTTQAFGPLTAQYIGKEAHEKDENKYLGRSLPNATFAGDITKDFYTAVIPNTNGYPLTLRLNYTLLATDGSGEEIKIYGAKAVVPATYTVWQPNYAYTYIFKISDNSNGWTSQTYTDPKGLFPITFDAVVTSFVDANDEQTTITTVATPSITTYQQGHDQSVATNDEYSKSQTAGVSSAVKDVYVQVMNNSGTTPTLVNNLDDENSLLFKITKKNALDVDEDYVASEAEVMDALQNRTDVYNAASPIVGRNGIKLTANTHIDNTVTSIINGVDDQEITEIAGTAITAGQVAKIDIDHSDVTIGTYAYVYASTVPNADKKVYNVVSISTDDDAKKYYEINPSEDMSASACTADTKAVDGKVYFVKNVDAEGNFVSWTFKQTKVGDDVEGLYVATIPTNKANKYTSGHFYFDVYYQNNGAYAVKVIKIVA